MLINCDGDIACEGHGLYILAVIFVFALSVEVIAGAFVSSLSCWLPDNKNPLPRSRLTDIILEWEYIPGI